MTPQENSDTCRRIGEDTGLVLVTSDLEALYEEWSKRGISFPQSPARTAWQAWQAIFRTSTEIDSDSSSMTRLPRLLPRSDVPSRRRRRRSGSSSVNWRLPRMCKRSSSPSRCLRSGRWSAPTYAFRPGSDDSFIVTSLDRKCLDGEMSSRAARRGSGRRDISEKKTRRKYLASLAHAELWERSKSGRWRMKLKPMGSRCENKEAGRRSQSIKLKIADAWAGLREVFTVPLTMRL